MSVNDLQIPTLMLPLNEMAMVLPNAAVAEVVAYEEPQPASPESPDWMLGSLTWRGVLIPVISYEVLNTKATSKQGTALRIAIVNTLSKNQKLQFIGVVLSGIPSLKTASPANVHAEQDQGDALVAAARVTIDGQSGWVPDLDALEQRVVAVWS